VGSTGGSCLGLAVDRSDALYICDPQRQSVMHRGVDGTLTVFADRVGELALDGPNFPVFGPDGALYVSCSGTWGMTDGWVARFGFDGQASVILTGLDLANGLAIDGSGDFLYVAETHADRVKRIALRGPSAPEVVVDDIDRLPDGLAFDAEGRLYISCYASDRIYAWTPDGGLALIAEDRESIALAHPTNIAFGGPRFDELFVACYALRHISRIAIARPGQRLYGGPPGPEVTG
jgi:gluconolactonase